MKQVFTDIDTEKENGARNVDITLLCGVPEAIKLSLVRAMTMKTPFDIGVFEALVSMLPKSVEIPNFYKRFADAKKARVHASLAFGVSDWLDNRSTRFFNSYPHATGIEVFGGISTRFHRVSSRLDWPKFAWLSINMPLISDYEKRIFGQLDNFKTLSTETPISALQGQISATSEAKLVIVGEISPLTRWDELHSLISHIKRTKPEGQPLELLVCHTFCCVHKEVDKLAKEVSLLGIHVSGKKPHLIKRFASRLIGKRASRDVCGSHFRIQ